MFQNVFCCILSVIYSYKINFEIKCLKQVRDHLRIHWQWLSVRTFIDMRQCGTIVFPTTANYEINHKSCLLGNCGRLSSSFFLLPVFLTVSHSFFPFTVSCWIWLLFWVLHFTVLNQQMSLLLEDVPNSYWFTKEFMVVSINETSDKNSFPLQNIERSFGRCQKKKTFITAQKYLCILTKSFFQPTYCMLQTFHQCWR